MGPRLGLLLALLAGLASSPGLALAQDICAQPAPPPGQRDPSALQRIVLCHCAPAAARGLAPPLPCDGLTPDGGAAALLKDIFGYSQYLLIPTARVTGIEDPALLAPGAPNYWAMAWRARGAVGLALRRSLVPDVLSLAINPAVARTQDQLHIHIDCVRADVRDALRSQTGSIGPGWAPLSPPLERWQARRLPVQGEALQADPFVLLATGVPGAAAEMGLWTVLVTATVEPPGLVALAGRAPAAPPAERLQDHGCALAR